VRPIEPLLLVNMSTFDFVLIEVVAGGGHDGGTMNVDVEQFKVLF
jgi:hypothetical protein